MHIKLDAVVNITLVVCALGTTGLVIRHEIVGRLGPTLPVSAEQKPVFINHWRDYRSKGVQMGPAEAPVQLLEFADFECPFCANLHQTLNLLRERYPTQVALTYVHLPLPMHHFAEPAARAAECAGEQGRFEAMCDRLFDQQKSFGLKPWGEFAMQASVPDKTAFAACIKRSAPAVRITEGQQLGQELNIRGTPTLLVNGWQLARPPSLEELDHMVKAVLAGKNPISADGRVMQ